MHSETDSFMGLKMLIKKDNLCIRNASDSDCGQLAAWWNDGAVMAHAGFPLGLCTSADKIKAEIAADSDDTRRRLIITCDDKAIGEMSFSNLGDSVAEIGIKICDTSYQEKGLGRKILSMLISELFSRGYSKIILDTNLKNTRAQHVYEMLGFTKIRVNVDSWKNQLGELQSSVDYFLTPDNFINFS